MKRITITATATLLLISAGACNKSYDNANEAYANAEGNAAYGGADGTSADDGYAKGNATATSSWPAGTRIVVDNGVTYRVEPGGVRVALGPSDSRILVENGVRYRVDPSGTRVRIDPSGAEISVSPAPGVTVTTNTQ